MGRLWNEVGKTYDILIKKLNGMYTKVLRYYSILSGMGPKLCERCQVANTLNGKYKYCTACQQAVLEEEAARPLCKSEGCTKKASLVNAYCGKHGILAWKEGVEARGKKVCTDYTRTCRAELELSYSKQKCPACLEKDRAKEKKRKEELDKLPELDGLGNKKCSTCSKYAPLAEYVGIKTDVIQCKACRDTNKRGDANRNKEERVKKAYENSKKDENRFKAYQKDARDQEKCFELTMEQFLDMTKKLCHYCGIMPTEGFTGIDRIRSRDGFTLENCAPCCSMCNKIKHNLSEEVFLRSVEHILTFSGIIRGRLYPEVFQCIRGTPFTSYQQKSERLGIHFQITREEFERVRSAPCYLCGKVCSTIHTNGVDRVDSNRGYTHDNIRPCCGQCNWMKYDFDLESFMVKLEQIYHYQNSKPSG